MRNTENQLSNQGSGLEGSTGELDKRRGLPVVNVVQQPASSSGAPRLREQLVTQYVTLMLEAENVRAQLRTVGVQSTQCTDQPHGDEPPEYYSQAGSGGTQPPGYTGRDLE